MTNAAAFKATFADWRTVKGRKQLQLILEAPLEQQGEILSILGAPNPSNPAWVAIALLDPAKIAQGASAPVNTQSLSVNTRERRNWSELSYAEQAGIRCNEPAFWRYVSEVHKLDIADADTAADFVRRYCGVASRADIGQQSTSRFKWGRLNGSYEAWRLVA